METEKTVLQWEEIELKLPLPPKSLPYMRRWVERFSGAETLWVTPTRIEGSCLCLSALALPFFLGYADTAVVPELEVRRIRSLGTEAIQSRLGTGFSLRSRALAVAWENLRVIRDGEFLGELFVSDSVAN